MAVQAMCRLPIIDFSIEDLKPGTSSWLSTRNKVQSALEEYGCFEAVYDKISLELHNEIFAVQKCYWIYPQRSKPRADISYFGYTREEPDRPLFQSLGINHASTLVGPQSFTNLTQTFTNQMWPAGNNQFCENALAYAIQIVELEQLVKRMVFDSYGVKKYLDPCIQFYNLRFLKYRLPDMDEANVGVENHTDKTFVSILNQNEVNGLEVKTKNGDWIKMELSPSSFVVRAGEAWSNGRIHTPFYRVILKGTKARYTVGLFSFQTGILQTPEELVDDKHPLRFKSFEYFKLLRYHYDLDDARKGIESTVKALCGV
nr:putative 2-oxoglutarate-dependent dioxygenase aop1.2 [Quercus suber]